MFILRSECAMLTETANNPRITVQTLWASVTMLKVKESKMREGLHGLIGGVARTAPFLS